jgi:DNA repair protein RAD50
LTSQEQIKRNVLGNIELRHQIQELQHLHDEYKAMEKQQGASARQYKDSQRELTEAQRQREELQSQRDTLRGRMAVYRQQVVALQAKLNDPTYRGVEERSRRKNIEYETTNMAASDIEIYHNTLDRAVQQFHSLKIREINKSIHTLWQQIYRGQDIDTIEIESGHDVGDGTEERAPSTSRSYNYRVVMKKGDLPLDMRGRCSAGQKVLAAIVIRLALAETFCVNCGILALDEPTTNLDDQNKEGLAEALALLIAARSHQLNFQLVCITHDLDFVRAIQKQLSLSSEESMPSHYFRLPSRRRSDW